MDRPAQPVNRVSIKWQRPAALTYARHRYGSSVYRAGSLQAQSAAVGGCLSDLASSLGIGEREALTTAGISRSGRSSLKTLGEWRRALLRILDEVDGRSGLASESLGARIRRLSDAGRIPRNIAAFMRSVTESRNETEYRCKVLAPIEAEAVSAAWRAVQQWAEDFAENRQRGRR